MGNSVSVSPPSPYAYEVPDSAIPGKSGPIYRNVDAAEGNLSVIDGDESLDSSFAIFRKAAEKYADQPCHGTRPRLDDGSVGPYEWQTYKEVYDRILNFGRGLEHLNLLSKSGDGSMRVIGIYMKNRSEWIIAEQGAFTRRATTVPLYDTLGEDVVDYIVNQVVLETVVCTASQIPRLVACKAECPSLTNIICVDPEACSESVTTAMTEAGLKLHSFIDVENTGSKFDDEPLEGDPTDIATFCYTSGTTGDPKGALNSHGNIVANVSSFIVFLGTKTPIMDIRGSQQYYLSYLPLPHIMERLISISLVHLGVAVGFYQGEPLKIMEDIAALRPTIFVSVPRLLNRLYDKITLGARAAGGIKSYLFEHAMAAKKARLEQGILKHPLWDKLVFDKIKARIGLDRVQLVASGSAPLATHVMDFLRVFFGCAVAEGYGQTECTCLATYSHPHDFTTGHVGQPVCCMDIKLFDVPEMGYLSTDTQHGSGDAAIECKGRGEICFRGPSVFQGYYKMPDKTEEAIDEDGWLHSGDVGLWLTTGRLKIIDRKKSIFKLSQGEYVSAERVENVITQSRLIAQAFVFGNSFHSCLVAVIVPDFEMLESIPGIQAGKTDPASLCKNEQVNKAILDSVREYSIAERLRGFEMVKAIHLIPEPFTVENDLLTPSFKLKRNVASARFQKEVDDMYIGIGDKVGGKQNLRQTD
ncbi:Long-chain-fatty-acid--CoA ligase, putative [Perkinsus marinus ATCC 50983]|uniref:Long-chain-fatty-acid--CoA ligase n=1 Tax=Perkinsus marinus (strain ATCC 50983 / TXsc) TaxID=423536 RepID=C5LAH6_PERM5|nr:Long-chain-fatty-acid--CoA ligase, putative [Perkinsus marinus ATCC 50983]EER06432.1 Long-chain-fatty-acid--CoA ligase, putative [Perkinsus marinus ATCC 50983]|eukprot:XP_002774616.1 Long-chain-fatty-acid--CoA ligase, putative [Perkinsus marinus ATCC 50983]